MSVYHETEAERKAREEWQAEAKHQEETEAERKAREEWQAEARKARDEALSGKTPQERLLWELGYDGE